MSAPYFKLTSDDQSVIRQYLSTTSDMHTDFRSLMYCKWGQRWLVKDEVSDQLCGLETQFRRQARTVSIAMCLAKAHGVNYGKRFFDKEEEGFYFVRRIFQGSKRQTETSGTRAPDFYDASFWSSPVVLVWIVETVDFWFDCPLIPEMDSFRAFVDEQTDEILGVNPHTDPDYP